MISDPQQKRTPNHYIISWSHQDAFHIVGPLWGKSTSHHWFVQANKTTVRWIFDVIFVTSLNNLVNKQSRFRWFETSWRHVTSLWWAVAHKSRYAVRTFMWLYSSCYYDHLQRHNTHQELWTRFAFCCVLVGVICTQSVQLTIDSCHFVVTCDTASCRLDGSLNQYTLYFYSNVLGRYTRSFILIDKLRPRWCTWNYMSAPYSDIYST